MSDRTSLRYENFSQINYLVITGVTHIIGGPFGGETVSEILEKRNSGQRQIFSQNAGFNKFHTRYDRIPYSQGTSGIPKQKRKELPSKNNNRKNPASM